MTLSNDFILFESGPSSQLECERFLREQPFDGDIPTQNQVRAAYFISRWCRAQSACVQMAEAILRAVLGYPDADPDLLDLGWDQEVLDRICELVGQDFGKESA